MLFWGFAGFRWVSESCRVLGSLCFFGVLEGLVGFGRFGELGGLG